MNKFSLHRIKWSWDKTASYGYNIIAKFEETLINLGVLQDFSDIEDTERFDVEYGPLISDFTDETKYFRVKFSLERNKNSSRESE